MAAAIAGEVLGPRPGKAICSFKEGIIEIVLRACSAAAGGVALLMGVLVLAFTVTYVPPSTGPLGVNETSTTVAVGGGTGAGALLLVLGVVVLVWEILMIVMRFLNIGLLNLKAKIFLSIDIIVQIVLAILFLVMCIILGYFAGQFVERSAAVLACLIVGIIVSAVLVGLMAGIVYLMIVFLVKDWTDKIIKYTLKDAVMG